MDAKRNALIEVEGLHKRYTMGSNVVAALNDVTLTIEEGDFVAIMGPSGSGKSTLMHVLGLLDVPTQGRYRILGRDTTGLSEDELADLRRNTIGFIFQQFHLLPRMTALENVQLPLLYADRVSDLTWARTLLERVHLDDRAGHRTNELSGGQQQRVAIARSLVNRPRLLFADEPTGNLDSASEREIMGILKSLNDSGITVVIVTHEEEIGRHAKRRIRMRDGVVQSDERLAPIGDAPLKSSPPQQGILNTSWKRWQQHFRQGIGTLAANRVRTALSVLGILIGVAAVVAMLALGRGAQNAIREQLASLGSNLLMLRPGAARGMGGAMMEAGSTTKLSADDADHIREKISGVVAAAPNVTGRAQVTFQNKNWSTSIMGVDAAYARMRAAMPTVGRFFTDDENRRRLRVAVIGATLVRELFDGANPIGEMIKINKVSFQVVGVLPEKGANSFRDQDDVAVVPVFTAMHRLLGKDYVDFIDIEIADAKLVDDVQTRVLDLMFARHRVPVSQRQDAFQVRNMADIQAALSASTRVMTVLLAIIAAISLLVGGIGIMNIMLVSVTERTREIGLRKAIGAKRWDILSQFLVEAVVVSLLGGTMGIVLAWLITVALSMLAGWATTITAASVVLAFVFSAGVGIVFGFYPARKASLLAPISALRHE